MIFTRILGIVILAALMAALTAQAYAQSDDYKKGLQDGLRAGREVIQALMSGDMNAYNQKAQAWNALAEGILGPEYLLPTYNVSGSSAIPGTGNQTNVQPSGIPLSGGYGPFNDDTWRPVI